MKNKKPIVVGVGELLWDMLPTGKRAGGAPVNVIFHASQLGAEGYAISAVGQDILGDELLKALDTNEINYIVPQIDYPTGTVQVTLCDGTPSYEIVEGVAWDFIPLIEAAKAVVSKVDAIAFGTLAQRNKKSADTICQLLQLVPKDAMKYYDINLRQQYYDKAMIVRLMELATVFKINDEELAVIIPMFGLEGMNHQEIALWFINRYQLTHFILTAGADYSSIYTPEEESTIKTPKVEVLDTVGAGDAFSGAFIYATLAGASLQEAHQKAVEIGAFVCQNNGAWPKHKK